MGVFCRHVLHQWPEIESIGVIAYKTLRCFVPANTGDFLLVVPVEDNRRAPDHLSAQKLVKIFVIFMDEGEKGVRRQSLEQIAQSEARHTDGVFQHVQS